MLFTGQAEITIDAKQRLAVPSKFRARLPEPADPETPTAWYCVPWPDGSILRLYPGVTFENQASLLDDSLTAGSDAAKIDTSLFGFAEHLEMDKNGRVRLPKWHLDLVEMPGEVIVVGARNRLEVHARAGWQANIKDRFREMAALIEKTERTDRRRGDDA